MIKEQGKKGILGLLACLIALLLIVADVLAAETRGLSFSYPVSNYSPDYQAFGNKNKFVNNNKHLGEDMRLSVGTAIKVIADGKIIYYGPRDGYGELVAVIEHDLGKEYAFNFAGSILQIEPKINDTVKINDTGCQWECNSVPKMGMKSVPPR